MSNNNNNAGTKSSRRGSGGAASGGGGKPSHSRSYPRGVGLDFRKLSGLTLLSYIDHHGVPVRPEAPPSELAVAVARHFETLEVNEDDAIGGFLDRLDVGSKSVTTDYQRRTAYFDGRAVPISIRKRQRSKLAARPGEQVAAKVTRTDENGSWILATVQRFYAETETYDVQDDDDTTKLIRLPWNHVMRLGMGPQQQYDNAALFHKGMDCMAIFPETTSFYRSKISKTPVWRLSSNSTTGTTSGTTASSAGNNACALPMPVVKEMIVRFEDDEDTNGRTPHRRVPARYVIPTPQNYFYNEADDVDLTLAS